MVLYSDVTIFGQDDFPPNPVTVTYDTGQYQIKLNSTGKLYL